MNKRNLIIAGSVVAALLLFWIFSGDSESDSKSIEVEVEKGKFEVIVTTTGELKAKNSVEISGPMAGMRRINIWSVQLSEIVPEGTMVDSGDYIATLDVSEISNRLKDNNLEIQKISSRVLQTVLDTTLSLRKARDELINMNFQLEEAQIKLEQSKYEPPATIRKTKIELEQIKVKYEQQKSSFEIKQRQAKAKVIEVTSDLEWYENHKELMTKTMKDFTITAPAPGIVMYVKDWGGKKIKEGSTLRSWDPKVAELPDLSIMMSKTYVNEVDVRKVKEDMLVEISVDAFPDKKLKGKVIEVANVGEQRPNSEAKVFKVDIEIEDIDSTFLPGMSTGNKITSEVKENTLYVPLECVNSSDSLVYVYYKARFGLSKKEVVTGISNENSVEILEGLEEGDVVLMSVPEDADDLKIEYLKEED